MKQGPYATTTKAGKRQRTDYASVKVSFTLKRSNFIEVEIKLTMCNE